MPLTDHTPSRSTWTLRIIGWTIALLIIVPLAYQIMFRKVVEKQIECLEKTSSGGRAATPAASVDKYAACASGQIAAADQAGHSGASSPSSPLSANPLDTARCRYAGLWSAARGDMVYLVTLEAGGRFVAEPSQNAPPNAATITGAWSVAGNSMAWAYDGGQVWPPDVNPISAADDGAFTLTEVNGSATRYTLVERLADSICKT